MYGDVMLYQVDRHVIRVDQSRLYLCSDLQSLDGQYNERPQGFLSGTALCVCIYFLST